MNDPAPDTPRATADDTPFGIVAAKFVLAHVPWLLGLTIGGFAAGIVASLLPTPRYVAGGLVEVGMWAEHSQWLEHPMVAAWRIRGGMEEAAHEVGVPLDGAIVHRREEKTNRITRFIDVSVWAETSTTARIILERGLKRVLEEHAKGHAHERMILEGQARSIERIAAQVEAQMGTGPAEGQDDEHRRDEIEAGFADLTRDLRRLDGLLSDTRSPATRVVARSSDGPIGPNRIAWAVAGALLGALCGLGLGTIRFVRSGSAR